MNFRVAPRTHPLRLRFCAKPFASTQKCTELRFCMTQICGPAALGMHSCKPRLDQNENGMLRTFIPAGSGLHSGGARDFCNRERGMDALVTVFSWKTSEERERNYGLGMDALVTVFSRNTNGIMVGMDALPQRRPRCDWRCHRTHFLMPLTGLIHPWRVHNASAGNKAVKSELVPAPTSTALALAYLLCKTSSWDEL